MKLVSRIREFPFTYRHESLCPTMTVANVLPSPSTPITAQLKRNMVSESNNTILVDGQRIDLRNRKLAAFLAWLVPGAGHFYQGRYAKSGLFFVCILSAWILGFALGGGHVVYASWQPGDKRWHYILQSGVGAVSLPALVQGNLMRKNTRGGETQKGYEPLWGGFMAPPFRPVIESEADEVSAWYARRGAGYEMGTWYTVIAGLLNILVIYDAYGGPLAVPISGRKKDPDDDSESEPAKQPAASEST